MGVSQSVLIIADEESLGAAMEAAVRQLGIRTTVARSLSEGLGLIKERQWTATILSLDLPGADVALAGRIVAEANAGALVLVAGEVTAELAMAGAQVGAKEVLSFASGVEQLQAFLGGVTTKGEIAAVPAPIPEGAFIGKSRALLEVFKQVGRVATSTATALVTGESGTGKELVARAIHAASPRATRPFVAVNCAAIPEDLLESELFGHERGAFTGAVGRKIGRFERAQGGTLFLDELGDMSLVLQAKILRVLQEREIERVGGEEVIAVDVRIVAATHRDLAALVASGDFREDLFYRLAVIRLHLPPLRERTEDIRDLALHYAARFGREYGRPIVGITIDALERLAAHSWPGNVRELGNVMERAVLAAPGPVISAVHIELDTDLVRFTPGVTLPGYSPQLSMAEVEALHIAQVLKEVDGHLGKAAEILAMHRNTVSRKAQEYGIEASP